MELHLSVTIKQLNGSPFVDPQEDGSMKPVTLRDMLLQYLEILS